MREGAPNEIADQERMRERERYVHNRKRPTVMWCEGGSESHVNFRTKMKPQRDTQTRRHTRECDAQARREIKIMTTHAQTRAGEGAGELRLAPELDSS